jgi:Flp pilus assembly protein TadG
MIRRRTPVRRGVAAAEVALITAVFMVPMVIGIWEIGRLIQVQQIVSNSAREGARLAAQGYTLNNAGVPTQVTVSSGAYNVNDFVYQYLYGAGLTNLAKTDVTVTFQFLAPPAVTEPYEGIKGQPFAVSVRIPWDKVRWINLGIINPTEVKFRVTWQMLNDDKFTVDDSLPTW